MEKIVRDTPSDFGVRIIDDHTGEIYRVTSGFFVRMIEVPGTRYFSDDGLFYYGHPDIHLIDLLDCTRYRVAKYIINYPKKMIDFMVTEKGVLLQDE